MTPVQAAPGARIRQVLVVVRSAIVGLGVALTVAVAGPTLLRWQVLTELTGSMSPALEPGDLVVVRPVSPLDTEPGDVVTFTDPEGTGRLITHRVAARKVTGADVAFLTRGDANNTGEQWTVAADGQIGRVTYRIPKVGLALDLLRQPLGRITLVVIPALVLGALEIAKIWRQEDAEPAPETMALPHQAAP